MAPYTHARMARFCGCSIETGAESASGNQRITEDWQEAQRKLRERLQARDDKILEIVRKGEQLQFSDWVDFFLENYSKPPIRAEKTHEANERAVKHLKEAFGDAIAWRDHCGRHRAVSSTAAAGSESRSRPEPGSFNEIGSSRRRSIRSSGCFAVC